MIKSQRTETIVRQRYAAGAKERADKLCCPVEYDSEYLKVIPQEVIERDYGCGDPSRYLREGQTVVDLGSGTGKICFIAAQIVGPKGKVIGVDMTDEMLEVARRNAPIVAERIGYANVEFRKGRIQDLALDLEFLDRELKKKPITDVASFLAADDLAEEMQQETELWSGCISDAFIEEGLLTAFERAGFYGIQILKRDLDPWRTVQGIEFRSVTLEAFKGKQGECFERNQAVIYSGPFKE